MSLTKNPRFYINGSKKIGVADAISVEEGHVWIVETNMDFEDLPINFRNRVKNSDISALDVLVSSVSKWALSNGFTAMNTYLCRIKSDLVDAFKAEWHHPANIENWSLEVNAPDEPSC